jgi:hypothetical protein
MDNLEREKDGEESEWIKAYDSIDQDADNHNMNPKVLRLVWRMGLASWKVMKRKTQEGKADGNKG